MVLIVLWHDAGLGVQVRGEAEGMRADSVEAEGMTAFTSSSLLLQLCVCVCVCVCVCECVIQLARGCVGGCGCMQRMFRKLEVDVVAGGMR